MGFGFFLSSFGLLFKVAKFQNSKTFKKSKLRNKSAGNALQMLWTKFEVNKINRNVSGSLSKMRCLLMVPLYSPKFWKLHNSKNWGKFKNKKNLSSGNVESNLNSIEELEMCPITFRSNVCADGHTLQSEILGTP